MSIPVLLLLATIAQDPQAAADSAAFPSPDIRALVERATVRRRAADSAVTDYQATVDYRLSVGFGRRQWARVPPVAVEQQVARIQWQQPNDLRVDVDGRRFRARPGAVNVELSSIFDRPWFVPRGVGDSVRIFSNDFPATGALHPLSAAGPAWYRYRRTGGMGLTLPNGQPLRLIEIEVMPRRTGAALIAGRLLIDSASADVVRMTFRYVGTALWARVGDPQARDSGQARRINAIANRVLSINADLEYALQDGRHWMPYRQIVFGTARIPIVGDAVIPFRATTVFDEYAINTGRPIAFVLPLDSLADERLRRDSLRVARRGGRADDPDSLRSWDYAGRWPGGRYELHRASDDSLRRYQGWSVPLELGNPSDEDEQVRDMDALLAGMAEELSGELTGRTDRGLAYERLGDLMRYNRVQGLSFGVGYRWRLPMLRYASLFATARYGLSDERVTGRLTIRSDAPGARRLVTGYRDVQSVDPFAAGRTLENSLNALFTAHDDGDYAVVTGAGIGMETSLGVGLDLSAGARVERQRSAVRTAESAVNDGLGGSGFFLPNPAIDEGTFGGMFVRLDGFGATRWSLTADALGTDGQTVGRLFGEVRRAFGGRRGATIQLKSGVGTEPVFAQTQFRLGGLNTVRGFSYGFARGPAFWAAQLDLTPLEGLLRPVAFVDAGQVGAVGDLFSRDALVGAGLGVSLLRGLIRFDFSVPVSSDLGGTVRFDFVVRGAR